MEAKNKTRVTVQATINAPIEKVWQYYNEPAHITQWAQASEDWHAPFAENDLRTGGKFTTTMAAKDGSFSFDFGGVYTNVEKHKRIEYTMGDGRTVQVSFSPEGGGVKLVQTFDAEDQNPVDMQQAGWQAILDSFKKHTETN